MPIASAHKVTQISESLDPRKGIMEAIGDISGIEVCTDWVLLGTYIAPNKIGSILVPDKVVGEDEYQGKCGLILKMGPLAFNYEDYVGPQFQVGDWAIFWVGDAKMMTINGTPCRMVRDDHLRMKIADPRQIKVI